MASLSLSVLSTTRITNCKAEEKKNHTYSLWKDTSAVKMHHSGWARGPHSWVCSCDANNPFTVQDSDPARQKADDWCASKCKRVAQKGAQQPQRATHEFFRSETRKDYLFLRWRQQTSHNTRSPMQADTEGKQNILVRFCRERDWRSWV